MCVRVDVRMPVHSLGALFFERVLALCKYKICINYVCFCTWGECVEVWKCFGLCTSECGGGCLFRYK